MTRCARKSIAVLLEVARQKDRDLFKRGLGVWELVALPALLVLAGFIYQSMEGFAAGKMQPIAAVTFSVGHLVFFVWKPAGAMASASHNQYEFTIPDRTI